MVVGELVDDGDTNPPIDVESIGLMVCDESSEAVDIVSLVWDVKTAAWMDAD